MLNDQKVGINNMNVEIKIYVKFHILDIVVITFHWYDFYCDLLFTGMT